MKAQQIIAANVAARGYRDGWTAEQFVARQLAKATEELAEVAACLVPSLSHKWISCLDEAGMFARQAFDGNREWWNGVKIDNNVIASELADFAVVLFTAAEALDIDIIQAAIDKSAADVARGVRQEVQR